MSKFFYFLMVGLFFAAFQVVTVEADHVDLSHCDQFEGAPKAACIAAAESGPPPGDDMAPTTDTDTCAAMQGTARDDCYGAKGDHPPGDHHECPEGTTCEGMDHHDSPPIDPRTGQPFTPADEAKYQKYADECDATNGLLSEGSAQELIADGFTRIQVDKLCKESAHDGPPPGAMCTNPAGGPMIPCPAP